MIEPVVVVEDFFVKTEEVRENIALVVAEEEAISWYSRSLSM